MGSMEHFVDLDQENTSVCSPPPATYLEKIYNLQKFQTTSVPKLQKFQTTSVSSCKVTRKLSCFGGFRHRFYGTFCRSRSGERIRVVPVPRNVPRKPPTPSASGGYNGNNGNDKPESHIRPQEAAPTSHTPTRAGMT